GHPIELHDLDIFCDGTAVRKAGALPFEICRSMLNRIATVTNAEVSAAIRVLWETLRCISEPSGAMGLAAVLKERAAFAGKKVLIVITGANIDFLQLGLIAQSEGAASTVSRTLRINIPERPGAMLSLLDSCFESLNIADFQYGLHHPDEAWPVFTVTAESAAKLAELPARLNTGGFQWQDLSGAVDVAFRAIPLRGDLLTHPLFLRLDFYERPGALHDFLSRLIRDRASLCYFNYRQSGERVGRALIGLTFQNTASRDAFLSDLQEQGEGYRSCKPVDVETLARMTA
ncbi:MAG: pyridoxal-phosphate dependent enzyme, partial [bacterium]